MTRDEMVAMLREAGHHEVADQVASVTPEDEARFDEWLTDPANKKRWDEALRKAKESQ